MSSVWCASFANWSKLALTILSHLCYDTGMPITSDRRIYVTFDNPGDVAKVKSLAAERQTSASKYILAELALLNKVRADPVGHALVKAIDNGQQT